MELLVQTCHRRGALATGGMAALLLPQDPLSEPYRRVLATVTRQEKSTHTHTHMFIKLLKALQWRNTHTNIYSFSRHLII